EHLPKIARNRDFLDRIRELAVLNPHSDRAPRVVAGDGIHAEANQLEDVQARLHRGNNFFGGLLTRLEIEVRSAYADGAGARTGSISRWLRTQFSRGIGALQVISENAILDNRRRVRGNAFI